MKLEAEEPNPNTHLARMACWSLDSEVVHRGGGLK